MCSHLNTQLILSCPKRADEFMKLEHFILFHSLHFTLLISLYAFHSLHFTPCFSLIAFHLLHFILCVSIYAWTCCSGVCQNVADHKVRTKQGTHRLELIWCKVVSQNGTDHMVRENQETHGSKWTKSGGVRRNGAGHLVRTLHPPTANTNSLLWKATILTA